MVRYGYGPQREGEGAPLSVEGAFNPIELDNLLLYLNFGQLFVAALYSFTYYVILFSCCIRLFVSPSVVFIVLARTQ